MLSRAAALLAGLVGFGLGLLVGLNLGPGRDPVEEGLVVTVIDGDTVVLADGRRVRYLGIDTPEVGQCFYAEATGRNRELVEGKRVALFPDGEDRDRFGRLLRHVFLADGTWVNAQLLWEGQGRTLFFGESRFRQVFAQLQLAAMQAGRGGWGACGWR